MQHGAVDLSQKHLSKYFSDTYQNKSLVYSVSSPNFSFITSFENLQLPIGPGFFPNVRNSPTQKTPNEDNLTQKAIPGGFYEWQGSTPSNAR